MDIKKLNEVTTEMHRLIAAMNELESHGRQHGKPEHRCITSPKHTGAVRRASMDLTRALADLRRRPS